MSFGQLPQEAKASHSPGSPQTTPRVDHWGKGLGRQENRHTPPSQVGVTTGRSVSHNWEQVIVQNGREYCKGMKFGVLNPLNKRVHSLGSSDALGMLTAWGTPSCIRPHQPRTNVDPPHNGLMDCMEPVLTWTVQHQTQGKLWTLTLLQALCTPQLHF